MLNKNLNRPRKETTQVTMLCRRLKDTVHIAQTIAATIGTESASPFEFRVLEALLAETAHHFEGKSRHAC